MLVPKGENSRVKFHGKNDQARKNLDKLTVYLVSLYLL